MAHRGSRAASRLVLVMLVTLVALVALDPATAANLMGAPFIPFLLALPYLGTRSLRRLAVASWLMTVVVAALAARAQLAAPAAASVESVIVGLVDACVAGALVLYLLWGYRERLLASGRDMARLMRLSRDVSSTLDPARVAGSSRATSRRPRTRMSVSSPYGAPTWGRSAGSRRGHRTTPGTTAA